MSRRGMLLTAFVTLGLLAVLSMLVTPGPSDVSARSLLSLTPTPTQPEINVKIHLRFGCGSCCCTTWNQTWAQYKLELKDGDTVLDTDYVKVYRTGGNCAYDGYNIWGWNDNLDKNKTYTVVLTPDSVDGTYIEQEDGTAREVDVTIGDDHWVEVVFHRYGTKHPGQCHWHFAHWYTETNNNLP